MAKSKVVPLIVDGKLNPRAKKRVRKLADTVWGWCVRSDWNYRCAVCEKPGNQPHHVMPRQFFAYRWKLDNGICLCLYHHTRDPFLSPHQNSAGWLSWLQGEQPDLYRLYLARMQERHNASSSRVYDTWDYCKILHDLRADLPVNMFAMIVGDKFNQWLLENVA